jgi:hypothetical protein
MKIYFWFSKKYSMTKFPKILIVRYYETWDMNLTYSDNWDENYLSSIYKRLDEELEENKHLETYHIFCNWEGIWSEEKREREEIKWKERNNI